MRTDAKDLALSVFRREQERSCDRDRERGDAEPKEGGTRDKAPVGSMAMKVYNLELMHLNALSQVDLGIEELREKKEKMKKVVQLEEEEKANIEREVASLNKRLALINASLCEKYAYVDDYTKTIEDVESAYSKTRVSNSNNNENLNFFDKWSKKHNEMHVEGFRYPSAKILESSQALLHVLKTENSNQIPQSAR